MPQMAPLNWLSLYLMFIFIFVLFCIMMFYTFLPLPNVKKLTSMKLLSTPLNWKW